MAINNAAKRPIPSGPTAQTPGGANAGMNATGATARLDPAATRLDRAGQANTAGQRVRSFVVGNLNTLAVLTAVIGAVVAMYDFNFTSKTAMHGSASAAHLLKHFPAAVAACEKSPGNALCQIPDIGLKVFRTMNDPMIMSDPDHHVCLADFLLGISALAPEMLLAVGAALAIVIYLRCPR